MLGSSNEFNEFNDYYDLSIYASCKIVLYDICKHQSLVF